jgi:HK97 gp10 family phage protein
MSLQVKGLREALDALRDLPEKSVNRVLQDASRRVASMVLKSARQNARKIADSGLLAKSLGIRVKRNRRTGDVVAVVGPRKGFAQKVAAKGLDGEPVEVKREPVKYAHLQEFGAAPHRIKATIRKRTVTFNHPGTKPRPWLRPAADANRQPMINAMSAEIGKAITKALAKLSKAKG